MTSAFWYHATTKESAESILTEGFKISPVKNGNFLGRGIYFANDLETVKKYGDIVFRCTITLDNIFYSEVGKEVVDLRATFVEDSSMRLGDQLKLHFVAQHYDGINIPANAQLTKQRKLVIYNPSLIHIVDWVSVNEQTIISN